MALMYSPPGELGSRVPEFTLPSVDGKSFRSEDFSKSLVQVYMFICNHCPYVKAIEDRIVSLAKHFSNQDVLFVGICSNSWDEHPEDSPQELYKRWNQKNYGFVYLVDEDQSVAKKFGAVCTPEFFVFSSGKLQYRGRLDDSWKNPAAVKRQELKEAIDCLLAQKSVSPSQLPSMGCSIKWKS